MPASTENDPSSSQSSDGMALFLYSLMQRLMQVPPRHMHCYENNIAIVASCKSLQSLNLLLTGPDLFSLKLDVIDSFNKYPKKILFVYFFCLFLFFCYVFLTLTIEARVKILDTVIRSRLSSISPSPSPSLVPLAMKSNRENGASRNENGVASDVDLSAVASKLDNYRASDISNR